MKTFITALMIVSTIILFSIFISYRTNVIALELLDRLSEIESDVSMDAYYEYAHSWEEHTFFFDTTLPRHKSELILEGMAIIESAIKEDDHTALTQGILISRSAIKSIVAASKLSLQNIL